LEKVVSPVAAKLNGKMPGGNVATIGSAEVFVVGLGPNTAGGVVEGAEFPLRSVTAEALTASERAATAAKQPNAIRGEFSQRLVMINLSYPQFCFYKFQVFPSLDGRSLILSAAKKETTTHDHSMALKRRRSSSDVSAAGII